MATRFLRHEPCPVCGSKDNSAVWWDDELNAETHYCYTEGCKNKKTRKMVEAELSSIKQEGTIPDRQWLRKMKLSRDTVVQYDLRIKGKKIYFGYRKPSGRLDRIKCRDYNIPKDSLNPPHFFFIGEKEKTLYGMQTASTKKKLLITTGEWDAIYAKEILGKWFVCVSVDRGDDSAVDTIKANYDWVRGFESIYLCFDNDESGQRATAKVAELLESCWLVSLPQYPIQETVTKDVKDFAVNGLEEQFKTAVFAAAQHHPKYILADDDLFLSMEDFYYDNDRTVGLPLPFPSLTEELGGLRLGEISVVMGIPGRGKSTICRQILAHQTKTGTRSLYITLEESVHAATTRLMESISEQPLLGRGIAKVSPPTYRKLFDTLIRGKVVVANMLGAIDVEQFEEVVTYSAKALDVKFVLLDHVTAATDLSVDQAKALRQFFAVANTLAQKLKVHIMMVSHTKNNKDDYQILASNEDPIPTIRDAFGSRAIEQITHVFLGIQATSSGTKLWVLKNRLFGIKNKWVSLYFKGFAFYERNMKGGNDERKGSELSGIGRNATGQSVRAGVLQQVPSTPDEKQSKVSATQEGINPTEKCDSAGGLQPRPLQVHPGNLESGLVDDQRPHNRDKGADGFSVPHEGEVIQGSTPRTLPETTLSFPGRKPAHPRNSTSKLQPLGNTDGDTVHQLEDQPVSTTKLADYLKLYTEGSTDDVE